MKYLWTWIDKRSWSEGAKLKAAMGITGTAFAAAGFLLWAVIQIWALRSWDWMVVFIGYPAIISWFVVVLYASHHDFHQGSYPE